MLTLYRAEGAEKLIVLRRITDGNAQTAFGERIRTEIPNQDTALSGRCNESSRVSGFYQ
jgi:GGDEF domain-containing protein